jgi:Tfp pilus assembly protein PilE
VKTSNRGFTLVEMLVIAPIVILAIGAFVTVIVSMVGEVLVSRSSNNLAYNVQDALNRIEQDVKLSSGYLAQNSITLDAANDQGYDDDAANFTNVGLASGSALILNAFATTGNPLSTTSSLVYLTGQPNACASSQISDNTPMTYNIVYYIRDNACGGGQLCHQTTQRAHQSAVQLLGNNLVASLQTLSIPVPSAKQMISS